MTKDDLKKMAEETAKRFQTVDNLFLEDLLFQFGLEVLKRDRLSVKIYEEPK
jgi:hypothetical protein